MKPVAYTLFTVLLACSSATIADGQVLAPIPAGGPVHEQLVVSYWGAHPIPPAYGGGFCEAEGPHSHPYLPVNPEFFAVNDGYYVFTGDPYFYGYNGDMRWFAGPHVMHYSWGDAVCYIDGPHRHWVRPYVSYVESDYVVDDGYWVYVGFWPWWYVPTHHVYLYSYWPERYHREYRPREGMAHKAMEKHPPRHQSVGTVDHEGKAPHNQGVPAAHAANTVPGYAKNPAILPAYNDHRPVPIPQGAASTPGTRQGSQARTSASVPAATNAARPEPANTVPGYTKNPAILPAYNDHREVPVPHQAERSTGSSSRSSKDVFTGNRTSTPRASHSAPSSYSAPAPRATSSGSTYRAPSFTGGSSRPAASSPSSSYRKATSSGSGSAKSTGGGGGRSTGGSSSGKSGGGRRH